MQTRRRLAKQSGTPAQRRSGNTGTKTDPIISRPRLGRLSLYFPDADDHSPVIDLQTELDFPQPIYSKKRPRRPPAPAQTKALPRRRPRSIRDRVRDLQPPPVPINIYRPPLPAPPTALLAFSRGVTAVRPNAR